MEPIQIPLVPYELFGEPGRSLGGGTYGEVKEHRSLSPELGNYGLHHNSYVIKYCKFDISYQPMPGIVTELLVACKIKHPRLATAVAYCLVENRLMLVFEEYHCNLREYLHRYKDNITQSIIYRIARDIVEGVSVLHANNISHLDIKLSNIMIREETYVNGSREVRASLIDFGSCDMRMSQNEIFDNRTTLNYCPPELLTNKPKYFTHTADFWSMACVLYRLYVGIDLFPRKSISSILTLMYSRLGPPTKEEMEFLSSNNVVPPKCERNIISYPTRITKLKLHNAAGKLGFPAVSSFIESTLTYLPTERPRMETIMSLFDIAPVISSDLDMVQVDKPIGEELNNKILTNRCYVEILLNMRHYCVINDYISSTSSAKQKLTYEHMGDVFYAMEYILLHKHRYPDDIIGIEHITCYYYLGSCVNGTHLNLSVLSQMPSNKERNFMEVFPKCLDLMRCCPTPVTGYDCLRWEYDPFNVMTGEQISIFNTKVNLMLFLLLIGARYRYTPLEIYNLLNTRFPTDVQFVESGIRSLQSCSDGSIWNIIGVSQETVRERLGVVC